ncbi:retinal cone rhodopsin-sensitive cGMP 3',5'-cyclic phosphodiesterase subunit gamma-like [Oryzias latipes]|uniref:3',5'-cyclic-GMP phosphodiesterase n=1 Tax=Oryzias latipes TaxID=8090 RepID=H2L2W3_ORYLA|nr:retinal cone rhodopsin-sensitive cGMP 3',5'-cyclic phosphodiesterase subunit gamma-like [Oryzias latipes]
MQVYKGRRGDEESIQRDCKKKEDFSSLSCINFLAVFLQTQISRRPSTQSSKMNAAAAAAGEDKAASSEFQQKESRQFKSKAPKPGQKRFDSSLPGMESFDDSAVVCPWEEFGDADLSELAQFGII